MKYRKSGPNLQHMYTRQLALQVLNTLYCNILVWKPQTDNQIRPVFLAKGNFQTQISHLGKDPVPNDGKCLLFCLKPACSLLICYTEPELNVSISSVILPSLPPPQLDHCEQKM